MHFQLIEATTASHLPVIGRMMSRAQAQGDDAPARPAAPTSAPRPLAPATGASNQKAVSDDDDPVRMTNTR